MTDYVSTEWKSYNGVRPEKYCMHTRCLEVSVLVSLRYIQICGSPTRLTSVLKAVLPPENGLWNFGSPTCLTGVIKVVFPPGN